MLQKPYGHHDGHRRCGGKLACEFAVINYGTVETGQCKQLLQLIFAFPAAGGRQSRQNQTIAVSESLVLFNLLYQRWNHLRIIFAAFKEHRSYS